MAAAARLWEGGTPCEGTRIGWAQRWDSAPWEGIEMGAAATGLGAEQGTNCDDA